MEAEADDEGDRAVEMERGGVTGRVGGRELTMRSWTASFASLE